jgi:RNA polymerase sigma factor (TIGR02999 family)
VRGEITEELVACRAGDPAALERLFEIVYDRLRRIARGQLGRGYRRDVLDTTSLVHEAFLKLVDRERIDWNDRIHFFSVASRAMRHVVIDAARARGRAKRGGGMVAVELRESQVHLPARSIDLLDLDHALDRLAELDPRLSRLVELRFFGGLTEREAAEALEVSDRTLRRDWIKAKAILLTLLDEPQRRRSAPAGRE